jgi:modulator of FtsH protease HflC
MKRHHLTFIIGILLALIFGLLLFCFQVRQTDIALVTTFGKPTRSINVNPDRPEPGLYFKWPWPVEKVQLFDKRIQDFQGKGDKFEETLTQDHYPLLIRVYAGWIINNPALFRERFGDSLERAQMELENVVRSAKSAVVGQHAFSHFVSPDEEKLRITQIEQEILAIVQPAAQASYGIDVRFLGIERLGLPQSITEKVFERMKEERQRYVQKLQAEGDAQARDIRSAADRQATNVLSRAQAQVIEIRGEAEAEAAKALAVFKENPELAIFLLKINALEESLKERSTLILDQRTPPFDLLDAASKNSPASGAMPAGKK